jgi:hypothetical protein
LVFVVYHHLLNYFYFPIFFSLWVNLLKVISETCHPH